MRRSAISAFALLLLIALPCQAAPAWKMVGDETTCSVILEPEPGTLILVGRNSQGDLQLAITIDRLSLPRDWYAPYAIMTEGGRFTGRGVTDGTQIALPANTSLIDDLSHDNTLFVYVGEITIGPFDTPALSADNRICLLGMPRLENQGLSLFPTFLKRHS